MATTEKKVSHTPSPWSLLVEGDEDSCIVRTVMGPGNGPRNLSEVALVTTGSYSDEVEEANAKLIAAGPELLEACRSAKRYDAALQACANNPETMTSFCTAAGENLDTLYMDWITKVEAAIKKATEP